MLIRGRSFTAQQVREKLSSMITPERQARIASVVAGRTYTVVSVLEDIYDRGNISAVMRSSEAMGFQAVHVIEKHERFKAANRVTQGADKWLDVHKWKQTEACFRALKQQGYHICVTSLDASTPIDELRFDEPCAIVLGNEKDGVSPEALALADARIRIPMHGFVQSFNISVAGALIFYHIYQWRKHHLGANGDLTPDDRIILEAIFYLRSVTNAEEILERS